MRVKWLFRLWEGSEMGRRISARLGLLLLVLSASLCTSVSHAAVDCEQLLKEPDYKPEDLALPMRFFFPDKGSCLGNAVENPYFAVGTITDATPSTFAEFAKTNPADTPIEFVSPGGIC
jgi:hypothetical protein